MIGYGGIWPPGAHTSTPDEEFDAMPKDETAGAKPKFRSKNSYMKALARFVEAGQINENGYSSGGTPFSQIIPSLRPSDITVSDLSSSSRQRGHTPSLPRRSSSYSRSKDKPPSRSSSPREPPPIVARYSSAALARRASEPHTKNAVQSQNDAARRASHPDDFERGRAAADGAKLESDEEDIQRELEKRDLDPSTFGTLRGTSQPYPFGALPPSRRDSGTELRPRRAFRNSISTNASQADTVTGTVSPTSLRPPTAQSSSSSGAQSSAPSSSSGPAPSIASSNSTAHPPSNQQPHPDRASSPANSHRKSRAPPPPRAARAPPGMLAPSSFFGGSRTKEHRGGKHERLVKGQQGGVTEEAETEESSDDDGVYPLQIDNFPALNEVQEGERTSYPISKVQNSLEATLKQLVSKEVFTVILSDPAGRQRFQEYLASEGRTEHLASLAFYSDVEALRKILHQTKLATLAAYATFLSDSAPYKPLPTKISPPSSSSPTNLTVPTSASSSGESTSDSQLSSGYSESQPSSTPSPSSSRPSVTPPQQQLQPSTSSTILPFSIHAEISAPPSMALPEAFSAQAEQALENLYQECFTDFVRKKIVDRARIRLGMFPSQEERGNLGDVFCLTDPHAPDHPIVLASDGFIKLTEYPRNQLVGRNCRFLQGPGTDSEAVGRLREAIKDEHASCNIILNYKQSGEPFYNCLSMLPLRDKQGKVRFFIGGQVDISGALASTQNLAFLLGAEQLMDAKNIKKMANNMSKTNEDSLSLSAEVVDFLEDELQDRSIFRPKSTFLPKKPYPSASASSATSSPRPATNAHISEGSGSSGGDGGGRGEGKDGSRNAATPTPSAYASGRANPRHQPAGRLMYQMNGSRSHHPIEIYAKLVVFNAEDHEILFITPPLLENLGYPTNEDKEKYDSSLLGTSFIDLLSLPLHQDTDRLRKTVLQKVEGRLPYSARAGFFHSTESVASLETFTDEAGRKLSIALCHLTPMKDIDGRVKMYAAVLGD